MFRISKDSPAYYITSVVKDRLPVFSNNCDEEHRLFGSRSPSTSENPTSEDVVLQNVNYVQQNPVRAVLVKRALSTQYLELST